MTKPDTYIVVPREMPVYGMVYDIVRVSGGVKSPHPIAMSADERFARTAAAAFTQACAQAHASWFDVTADAQAIAGGVS